MEDTVSHDAYPDELIRSILKNTKVIAVVGISNNETRPSHGVTRFLRSRGYRTIGVNPGLAGKDIGGTPVYASLGDVPEPVDMVDIFRNSEDAGAAVDDALAMNPLPKVIWMQLGVRNEAAAARAEAMGVTVIMNRCPAIEYPRLMR
jgi:predicted CoA-binding protein